MQGISKAHRWLSKLYRKIKKLLIFRYERINKKGSVLKALLFCLLINLSLNVLQYLTLKQMTALLVVMLYLQGCFKKCYSQRRENLYLGNSGTGIRLLTGYLSGLGRKFNLSGDMSLSKRPMDRIADPLNELGAKS
ncbi:MAG: hypothetical protein CM15mP12_2730 [Gammaproteobacteria bacterium]|nr:MAG: hypothetical protein CM15mP12_2730 [Gammaproteobacteria bacterium]